LTNQNAEKSIVTWKFILNIDSLLT
jgi:hypothetical protein